MARRPGVAVWRRTSARPDTAVAILLGALALLPMLWTKRGQVSADTKTYLTLDPGDLLASAASMWDPSVGAGTVPHQNIGYLFPLGPYYWVLDTMRVPDWLAQRLLWSLLVFAASYGTYRLLRWLGWRVSAGVVAAVTYGFSPYLLSYLARLSAILFPWAALPWMVLLAARAARERSWRRAAQFALVVALVSSVNATSLVFAGLGPVLWLIADAVSGRVASKSVAAAALRIGALSAAVSAWWIAGLRVQGTYGLPILDFTETYQTVASASTPPEILRGMGYWFYYGGDFLDPWVGPAAAYFNNPAVMFLSFGLAGCALLGLLTPFRGRGSMLLLFGVGLVLSVGAAPLGSSTWYGGWYEQFATETTAGAALRSTPRAAPLLLLALACGLGAGTMAIQEYLQRRSRPVLRSLAPVLPAIATLAALVNLLPWFTGNVTSAALLRPENLPAATTDLAGYLDRPDGPTGRVYAIPGADFADYRWGGTVDPVLPGLTDRSVLYRELIPQGGPGTADLLGAFERRLFEGWFEPASLLPIAELFAVDTVVVRNDLQQERYRLARPGPLWTDVTGVLGDPDYAGVATIDQTGDVLTDEIALARSDAAITFPTNAAFEIGAGDQLVLRDATDPLIVAGSGDGLVDLAAAGLLDTSNAILYAAALDDEALDAATTPWWIITDTNRKQGHRWSTLGFNLGAIESASPLQSGDDPGDSRLELFDDRLADQTIAVRLGDVADVSASSYGSGIVYIAGDAPDFAVDGDTSSAWRGAIAAAITGLRFDVEFANREELSHLMLLQPQFGANDRFITRVRITTDDGSFDTDLTDDSRTEPGQRVDLPSDLSSTSTLSIEVLADNVGDIASYVGQPGVGFAEIGATRNDGTAVLDDRVVRLPVASDRGITSADRLTYLFTRERFDPATPNRQAPERSLERQFDVVDDRSFSLTGQAHLAGTASDEVLDTLVAAGSIDAVASTRLPGSAASRGSAAVDGDLATAWQTPFDGAIGATLTLSGSTPLSFDELTLSWRDDGKHAVPTTIAVRSDTGPEIELVVPAIDPVDGVATATLALPAQTADDVTLTLIGVSDTSVNEYYSGTPRTLPVAIAEVQLGSLETVPAATFVDTGCRSDLLTVDGSPVPITITGPAAGELAVTGCGDLIDLGPGAHRLTTARGEDTGIDIDRLVLDDLSSNSSSNPERLEPPVTITSISDTAIDATVPATTTPTWLVLPQSHNLGWTLSVDGRELGEPQLINGYANGWLLDAGASDRVIELRWTPQRTVDVALGISAVAGLAILGLLVASALTRRRRGQRDEIADPPMPRSFTARTQRVAQAATVVGFLVVGGPLAAVAALAMVVIRRTSLALVVACIGWGLVSGLIIALEWRFDYADGPDWPLRFAWAAPVTWIVVAAVVTSALTSVLAARRPSPEQPAS